MRYWHHGPAHELRMWLQLFTHWPFILCLVMVGIMVWLLVRIVRSK